MPDNKNDTKDILQYEGLPYVPEIVSIKLISYYHSDLLADYFDIIQTCKLIARKYY